MLKRLRGVRKRGSPMAKPAIRTIRKMSGAKRARNPMMSVLAGGWGSEWGFGVLFSFRPLGRFCAKGPHCNKDSLSSILAIDLAGHAAFAHGDDAITDGQDLR